MKPPILFFGFLMIVGFISIPGAILILFGSLPAISGWVCDRTPGKPLGLCVGLMNIAAIVFHLIEIIPLGHDLRKAMPMVTDVMTWLSVYSVAFIGWGVYFGLPHLFRAMLHRRITRQAMDAKDTQEQLVQLWGMDIVSRAREAAALPD